MGVLVTTAILTAIGAGTALRDHLTADGQYAFAFIALAAIVLLGALGSLAAADGLPRRGKDGRA
jgi:Na+/H+ antiporter NhaC